VKMSKSLGNVINPDDVIAEYGSDTMRMYEMFMGPLEVSKPWSTGGIAGVYRFLERVYRMAEKPLTAEEPPRSLTKLLHKTVKKVTKDTGNLEFNTAISQMMIFINEAAKEEKLYRSLWEPFVLILSPYAPHLGEELWERLGNTPSNAYAPWPAWDEELTKEDLATVVVQINSKIRGKLEVPIDTDAAELSRLAFEIDKVKEQTAGRIIVKVVAIPGKLVNIVMK
jgi:leucyl-tRNA synthetase